MNKYYKIKNSNSTFNHSIHLAPLPSWLLIVWLLLVDFRIGLLFFPWTRHAIRSWLCRISLLFCRLLGLLGQVCEEGWLPCCLRLWSSAWKRWIPTCSWCLSFRSGRMGFMNSLPSLFHYLDHLRRVLDQYTCANWRHPAF